MSNLPPYFLQKEVRIISRKARKELDANFFHIIIQGVNKEYIFGKKEYIQELLKYMRKFEAKSKITMIAYCIMNNHAHFLIFSEEYDDISWFMHRVSLNYAQYYNKTENRCGVLFRNRYKAEPIKDVKYLANCIHYIHMNPVKAKMVNKCEEYPYSSYNDFLNNTGSTQSNVMVELFGRNYNYLEMFNSLKNVPFEDIDEISVDEMMNNLESGINEFKRRYGISTANILSNETSLKNIIVFLKNFYKIEYRYIKSKFQLKKSWAKILNE